MAASADEPIYHVSLIHLPDAVERQTMLNDVFSLKDKCLKDGRPYIIDIKGGGHLPWRYGPEHGLLAIL